MKVELTLLHAGVNNSHFLLLRSQIYIEKKNAALLFML